MYIFYYNANYIILLFKTKYFKILCQYMYEIIYYILLWEMKNQPIEFDNLMLLLKYSTFTVYRGMLTSTVDEVI